MRKIVFLVMCLSLTLSCSKEEKEADYITIDREKITLNFDDEKTVLIETNLDNVTAFIEDDYVAGAYAGIKSMDVWTYKVGKTKIIVKGGTAQAELQVEVIPKEDNIGTPVIALGKDMAYIKENEDAEFKRQGADYLTYYDDVPFGASHTYYFQDNKLEHVLTTIPISKLNSNFNTYLIQISKSLTERYALSESCQGQYRLVYMYHYKNEYYIGIVKGTGNGDWYLCYAKTRDEIMKYLDKHPSIAI